MFNTVEAAVTWVESQIKFRPKTSLDYIKNGLSLLDIDLSHMKKIHVTGTNGKGSVCMNITSILVKHDLKVGTFTSPYLVKFNERIKLNGIDISDQDLLKEINHIYVLNEKYASIYGFSLSFFELLTLVSLHFFSQEKVDVIIMEVGIGGLLDATNILNYDVSVITNIGMDHMKQLGNTLESIALNKLGIVKENNTLFTTVDEALVPLFMKYCTNVHANFNWIDKISIKTISEIPHVIDYKNKIYKLSLLGQHQKSNSALAIEVVKFLFKEISDDQISLGLSKTVHPGRLETVLDGVIIDGAHNMHAIDSLIFSLQTTFKEYNISVLFSALSDKEPLLMLKKLEPYVHSITTTAFPDTRYESLEFLPYKFEKNPKTALLNLIKEKSTKDLVLVTGSLHFIGYMKKEIIPALK